MKIFLRLSAAVLLLAILAGQSLAAPIGQVSGVVPGAFVDRGGEPAALNLKDSIEAKDTLRTDASGRVQVLFADNTSVTLGPNTVMTMQEFVFEEGEPAFKANLGQGLMRTITGAIVEQNPKGFGITTPEAHIGIRGTIVTTLTKDGFTTVWVENTTRMVYVNNIDVPSGQKITVPATPPLLQPVTPQDREFIESELAMLQARAVKSEASWSPYPATDLAGIPLPTQVLGDNLSASVSPTPTPTPTPLPVPVTMALFSGSLTSTMVGITPLSASSFSFELNLSTGAISNAAMHGESLVGSIMFDVSGGTGTMNPNGSFTIGGYSGTATSNWPGAPIPFAIVPGDMNSMTGNPTGGTPAVGGAVSGSYIIDAFTNGWTSVDMGNFTGARTR